MDGFWLQGELDLTLFYKTEGYFEKPKSLMTLMTVTLMTGNDRSLMISEVSGRFFSVANFYPSTQ